MHRLSLINHARFGIMVLVAFLLNACQVSECERRLSDDFPEIVKYMTVHELPSYAEVICETVNHNQYYFSGFSETNAEGIFYNEELVLNQVKITTFKFPDTEMTKVKGQYLYEFIVYECSTTEDTEKLINFLPAIDRMYNHYKELHEFFVENDKVFLYYFGFP